ncbi:MAG: PH domain-containing protein [Candidatus Riflebacteria bacterium]|nr:PH domain-containing protein [Candidatus Riflebacteria bacterium]
MSEEIIYDGRIPTKVFLFSHNPIWILLLGWNIGLLLSILQSFCQSIRITSQRVILTTGFISRKIEEVEYYKVKDTSYDQHIMQRLGGVGEITIFSDDVTSPQLTFSIHDPVEIREKIREFVRTERGKMRSIQVD